jgi:predicted acetyltransferase
MGFTTRPITEDEILRFRERISIGFGEDLSENDRDDERFKATLPLDRTVAGFDGDELVGTLGGYPLEIIVPGGASVPMSGTTIVTVQPTHRRQGILNAMMVDHLDDSSARGEALVGLWASETPIYGRYGFGRATSRDVAEASNGALNIDGPMEGTVRYVESAEVGEIVPAIFDEVRTTKPGMLSRSEDWWKHRILYDPERWREGSSAKRFVVYEVDGQAEGYAIYTQKPDWGDFVPNGQVRVKEIMATTDRAHTGLWNFVAGIDLFPRVRHWNVPADDPLWWKLSDPRRVDRKRTDALWLRIMDVPAALEARTYETDGSIRIRVDDPFRPDTSGVYELAVSDGVGKCVAVEGDADLRLGIDALGALYLGGNSALAMAAAGLIDGADDHVTQLHRMFHTDVEPWCDDVF